MPNIQLKSSDGEVFTVAVKVAECSFTIKTMLEDLGMEEDDEPIPLPNVNKAILTKVLEWATYHKDDPVPPEDEVTEKRTKTDDICDWDTEFLKVDINTLVELIRAANYLDIKGLLDITCKTVANMIKDKTPEEIRETFKPITDSCIHEETSEENPVGVGVEGAEGSRDRDEC